MAAVGSTFSNNIQLSLGAYPLYKNHIPLLMHLIFTFYFLSTSELKNHVNLMSTAVLNFCMKAALKAATVLFGITSMNANCACVTILRVAMRCSRSRNLWRNLRQLKQRTQLWHDTRSKKLFMCGYRFMLVFLDDKDLNSCRYVRV